MSRTVGDKQHKLHIRLLTENKKIRPRPKRGEMRVKLIENKVSSVVNPPFFVEKQLNFGH